MAGRKGRGEQGLTRGEGRRDVSVLEVGRTQPGLRLRLVEAERPRVVVAGGRWGETGERAGW